MILRPFGRQLVKSYSEACKLSMDGTYDFLWGTSDYSAYAGVEGTRAAYMAVVTADGKSATAYLGAAGAGETLGAELLNANASEISTDTSEWDVGVGATLTRRDYSVAPDIDPTGGADEFGIEVASGGSANSSARHLQTGLSTGSLVKISTRAYSPSGNTATNTAALQGVQGDYTTFSTTSATGEDAWETLSGYGTLTGTSFRIYLRCNSATAGDLSHFDLISGKIYTDCATTALHCFSDITCSTRGWVSTDSGFDYNAASYDVQIFKLR